MLRPEKILSPVSYMVFSRFVLFADASLSGAQTQIWWPIYFNVLPHPVHMAEGFLTWH